MEEAGTRVASPISMYNTHVAPQFCDTHPMAKKRSFPFQATNFTQHLHQSLIPGLESSRSNWNPNNWEWDSSRLVAKPLEMMEISRKQHHPAGSSANSDASKKNAVDESEEDGRLLLKLGGGAISSEEPVVTRPTKRVCSGSLGSGYGSYPMCQVDNCKEDLSAAKDYHRRHKVCEVHSKAGKALVAKLMQRFCQQCSRFHALSEFDEGKRSCRHRLAGHNKRRRKAQPEDVTTQFLLPANGDKNSNGDMDIVKLLTVLARAQGNTEDCTRSSSPLSSKDQLIQILNKINLLPMPADLASKSNVSHDSNIIDQDKVSSQTQSKSNGKTGSSTMDLLAVLSGGERSSTTSQSCGEDSDSPNLPLQLFSSSTEDNNSPPKLASSRKYFSSDSSSTPMDDRSPSSSPPVVQRLFPTKASRRTMRPESMSLELFGGLNGGAENTSIQGSYRAGYASSSGSDQSPSSLNYNPQDRTGRILFKLFDKDPSQLPGSLRTQIYNWLSHSPSDMEGYIRPGCIVLSIYVSMSSSAWDKLERNFLEYINSLLQDSRTDFWGNGRFLIHTNKHLASHKDGKVHLCKSSKKWRSPQLISISPLAVAAGKETSLFLKGRNLSMSGTKIYCTHANGCMLKEISKSLSQESAYDEISTCRFTVCTTSILGRCFIEVENGFRGTSFPIIIADATVCQELKLLEAEMAEGQSSSRDEILHFLNELGWLFQRKREDPCYSLTRFKFIFIFSVERDFCALVKTLLGILLQKGSGITDDEVSQESMEMLDGINLLNRAVKRRCKNMVDMLVRYAVLDDTSRKYIFPPNLVGPGGITPLHLAACMSNSDDLVDALTNDPQEVGLLRWNSSLDANGLSPFMYASMRNNNTYNTLVAQKLADRIAAQVSVSISSGLGLQKPEVSYRVGEACSRCALVAEKYPMRRSSQASQNMLHRPYIHSMLAIAAVCVCVCLFLRGAPNIGSVAPFKWENLNFGSI